MDVYIVDEEINKAVNGNANANKEQPKMGCRRSDDVAGSTRYGEYEKKKIVLFKKSVFLVLGLVVVFVPVPQQAMHNVFVCRPGHEFHGDYGNDCNSDIKKRSHDIFFSSQVVSSSCVPLPTRYSIFQKKRIVKITRLFQLCF